jgi:hypothetical protein
MILYDSSSVLALKQTRSTYALGRLLREYCHLSTFTHFLLLFTHTALVFSIRNLMKSLMVDDGREPSKSDATSQAKVDEDYYLFLVTFEVKRKGREQV